METTGGGLHTAPVRGQLVALGIVASRNGRSRNGHVRNGHSRIGCSRIGTRTATAAILHENHLI